MKPRSIEVSLAQRTVCGPQWRVEPDNECLVWVGYRNEAGYGRVNVGGSNYLVHRLSWVAHHGRDVPEELTIDHLCRVHACVSPAHLEAVTQQINVHRGTAPAAINLTVTHCPEGHPLEEGNLVLSALPRHRKCLLCHRETARRQREAIRLAADYLGMTWGEYVAVHGWSGIRATEIFEGVRA